MYVLLIMIMNSDEKVTEVFFILDRIFRIRRLSEQIRCKFVF